MQAPASDSSPRRVVIIANPRSGRGKARRRVEELTGILQRRARQVEVFWTERALHASGIASQLDPAPDCLVVAGGDGTVSEVLNGLDLSRDISIAVLGVGSQNLLVREFNLPTQAAAFADMLIAGHCRRIDLGLINGKTRFSALCSAGLGARVMRRIADTRKDRLGSLGYVWPFIREALAAPKTEIHVQLDGGEDAVGALVIVSNIKYSLWNIQPADQALCDSGELVVTVLHRPGALAIAKYMWLAWRKKLSRSKGVSSFRVHSVSIDSGQTVDVQYDGEPFGVLPVTISVLPQAIRIVVPCHMSR